MRKLLLLLSLLLTASLALSAENATKNLPVGAAPRLRIECDTVRIIVHGDNHGAVYARFDDAGYAEAKFTVEQKGDEILLRATHHRSRVHFGLGDHVPTLEVSAPADTLLSAHDSDGSIRVNGLRADAKLDTRDGSIHVDDYAGHLQAHSGDGSVRLQRTAGEAELETNDGSITIDDAKGAVRALTHDGSIRADGVFSGLQLRTKDGSIRVTVESGSQMNAEWRITTDDGSITARLPQGFAAQLDASSGDGRVYDNGAAQERGRSYQQTLNGGSHRIELRTNDGSVRIER